MENVGQKMNFLYDSDQTEIRLLSYRSFSTFWNIYTWWPLHSSLLFIGIE